MTVEEKMNKVLDSVLGMTYTVKIINDNEFEIYYRVNTLSMNIKTVKSINSHWKELISDALHKLVSDIIKMTLE